jgi:chromosome segregation ATPase
MFTHLSVQDFQSIAGADIELAPFTVIVGENRSGKTALLRAIRNVLSNKTGSGFIRRGKARCVVSIGTLEGDVVVWEKSKTTATYTLNGAPFSKMAGSVPEEVRAALGVREVVVDSTLTLSPQLALGAGDNLFLIDKSPGQAARALAKLTRLDVVVKAQVLCKQAIRRLKDELKAAQSSIGRTQEELDEFTDLETRGRRIAKATKTHEAIVAGLSQLARMNAELRLFDAARAVNTTPIPRNLTAPLPIDLDSLEDALHLLEAMDDEVVRPEVPVVDLSEDIEYLNRVNGGAMMLPYAIEEVDNCWFHVGRLTSEAAECKDKLDAVKGEECPLCGGTL